jgi:hypothetical protein
MVLINANHLSIFLFVHIQVIKCVSYFFFFFFFIVDKKVNVEELRSLENTLSNVTREQKEVLLALVNLFVGMLDDKLKEYNEQDIQDPMSQYWFWWAYGFFKEIGRCVS